MKKIIAILFLSLISLATVTGNIKGCSERYEQIADSEESGKDGKEDKEFTSAKHNKSLFRLPGIYRYSIHQAWILPAPTIDMQTPPPDLAG